MLEQRGRILEQVGGLATVRMGPVAGCPACAAGKGCGAGILGRLLQRDAVLVQLENLTQAMPGDVVIVGIPERVFLSLVLRLYLRPLLMGLAGAVLGNYFATRMTNQSAIIDGFSLLLGFVAAGLGVAWSRSSAKEPGEVVTGRQLQVLAQVQDDPDCSAQQD
jgi:sigma-E factor negative regulatory protein RseC